ncbi:TRAP transporter small permease [Roseovarius sp. C7]|uniref:TRAP transporter small permease n=1 Tax=Roseovarius sp. C7 TaxID=3398643 RepID=UPI0039F698C9
MKRLEHLFVRVNAWALIVMLSLMTLIVGSNIALRYATGQSLSWADEAARYLMIWMTFSGAGLALRYGGHVAITNLQDQLPATGQRVMRALLALGLLLFFGYMVYVGIQYAQRMQYQVTPALRLPFLYVYAAMPVGFSLLIVHLCLIARPYIMAGHFQSREGDDGAAGSMPGAASG